MTRLFVIITITIIIIIIIIITTKRDSILHCSSRKHEPTHNTSTFRKHLQFYNTWAANIHNTTKQTKVLEILKST